MYPCFCFFLFQLQLILFLFYSEKWTSLSFRSRKLHCMEAYQPMMKKTLLLFIFSAKLIHSTDHIY
ncbi:hypothetical protein ERO13_A11G218250v2 [Gossypium hirsutum]|nr:hypothetical protein ERO13_A11G218250v2 [Gossypium hirsutum]